MDPKYNPITLLESFWEKLSLLERKSKMNEGRSSLLERPETHPMITGRKK
jgi:hypothetical protein